MSIFRAKGLISRNWSQTRTGSHSGTTLPSLRRYPNNNVHGT